ncbi:hypothetical protein D7322_08460 [Sphingobacterium puteale]|uniref:Uncharacterized protein n=1 Tax=Sphingobacterium puteale TaxID=2420510 RepID=A0A420W0K4_9SPHI|nr:hypothetical protein D7322_08460 [Sphingobacterium puteale]
MEAYDYLLVNISESFSPSAICSSESPKSTFTFSFFDKNFPSTRIYAYEKVLCISLFEEWVVDWAKLLLMQQIVKKIISDNLHIGFVSIIRLLNLQKRI